MSNDGDELDIANCIGCGCPIGPDEAHNETAMGTRCEACQQASGEADETI